jgi:hypothetical protein
VGFKLILLFELDVAVDNDTLLVATDDVALVVRDRDGHYCLGVVVHCARVRVVEFRLCVPLDYNSRRCACDQLLPVLDPFQCEQGLGLLVGTFRDELRARGLPVRAWVCKVVRVNVLAEGLVGQDWPLVCKVEGTRVPCIGLDLLRVVLYLFLLQGPSLHFN